MLICCFLSRVLVQRKCTFTKLVSTENWPGGVPLNRHVDHVTLNSIETNTNAILLGRVGARLGRVAHPTSSVVGETLKGEVPPTH